MRKSFFLALTAPLMLVPTAAIAASPPAQPVTIRVPYGDLDIASPQDAAVLKRRIALAVGKACRSPSHNFTDEKCRSDALRAAFAVMERRRAVQVAAAAE